MSDELVDKEILHNAEVISGMYENWFLEYASYVILERAVPAMEDGLKPVQRRILHAMKEMDDGRFNKVANIIGQSMQYHPHGDASIGEAIVNMGQKNLLIETQGNWGDVRTGDGAAASRYIEARLSRFALDVVFNPDTTEWQLSYDGRKKEPVTLPVKFPLLLAQGVEGIAVGLATKILPHNFIELIEASIEILKGKEANVVPDFITGGQIDTAGYNGGQRGGKVRVRARIEELDKKTLVIRDVPYGVTTEQLKESIVKAGEAGKIKIKKPEKGSQAVEDNTAAEVEIQVHLAPGTSPDITIDALYAFTDCEVSISPNACVIVDEKPHFMTVNEILRVSTFNTKELLRRELEIRKAELLEKLLYASLEKIFIENRIYRKIEECETWEEVIVTIDKGLKPFKKQFYREITTDDIVRLTEIKIKRISRYDGFKADELMKRLQEELTETEDHLANLTRYAIAYFKELLKKYGKGRERKTELRSFNTIAASQVAAANQKLFVNRRDGFVGYGLKKDDNTEQIGECSDIDDIIVFRRDGKCTVRKVMDKDFFGKDIIHVSVFKKNDERMVYNMAYLDGKTGVCYVKRFQITAVTRDRDYELAGKNPGSKVLYFSANPNAEAETVTVGLTPGSKAKAKVYDFDFADIDVKGREAIGNILTKYPVKKVTFKSAGTSTMGGLDIWYDDNLGRLNTDKRGKYLGNFEGEDRILVVYHTGEYELTNYEFTNRYEPKDIAVIEKFNPERVISVVHYDGAAGLFYAKRFKIERTTVDKKFSFIGETKGSRMVVVTTSQQPQIEITTKKGREEETTMYDLDVITEVRGWKAMGHKLPGDKITKVKLLASRIDADVEWKMNGKSKDKEDKEKDDKDDADEKGGQLGMF